MINVAGPTTTAPALAAVDGVVALLVAGGVAGELDVAVPAPGDVGVFCAHF